MNMTAIILLLVAAWIAQLVLSLWQTRRYFRRISTLRKDGTTSVGMAGSAWKRRIYAILVVDDTDKIVHAEQFSGWTVFAVLKPVPELVGHSLEEISEGEPETFGIKKKMFLAFQNSASEFNKSRKNKELEDISIPGIQLPDAP
ncbi:MAG: transcriptional regulator [Anaerolineales bacterium]|nr:MAG: transcriptional regulator [Anaerolineales bacterium]